MRALLCTALLLASSIAFAQDEVKPLSIAIQPLGDREQGVVTWLFFRFANPNAITEAGLFLEGSITEAGHVPRNFRFPVPRKNDKFVWNTSLINNGRLIRHTRWSVLPDQRNELSFAHTFAEGKTVIDVQLVLEGDYGRGPQLVARATETFTIAKTNQPYTGDAVDPDALIDSAHGPEEPGSVAIRIARRKGRSEMVPLTVDAPSSVKRVEYWVDDKKVFAQHAPPFSAEVDPRTTQQPVTVRAIAYDAKGQYVDAGVLLLNQDETSIAVRITRTVTADGTAHFKLTVHNPSGTRLKSVALYADDRKLREWDRPPYTLTVPLSSLAGVASVRAVAIDEGGAEASDVLALH